MQTDSVWGCCRGRAGVSLPHGPRPLPAYSGASDGAAESPDLCAHRRGSGGGRLHVLAGDPAGRPVAALGGARDLHRGSDHRHSRRLFRAHLGSAVGLGPYAGPDRRQAAGGVLPVDAGGGRDHQRLAAVGRNRDPVPRDPGIGPARIYGGAAGERPGDLARQVEAHVAARRHRLPARRRRGRRARERAAAARHLNRHPFGNWPTVDFGLVYALYRLGLFPRRRAASDQGVSVKLLYFAWVRERIGKTEEVVEVPAGLSTVGDLITWLAGRGEEYANAFANPKVVCAAIDRAHVRADAPIAGAREIAFFPPMTGGGSPASNVPGGVRRGM